MRSPGDEPGPQPKLTACGERRYPSCCTADAEKGQGRRGDGEGRVVDRLTSPNPARCAKAERHRREVQAETLEAVDEVHPEVPELNVDARIPAVGQDRHVLQCDRARSHL